MILHTDIFVSSMERSLEFYVGKLGWSVQDDAVIRGSLARFLSNGHYDAIRLVLLKPAPIGTMVELQEFQRDSALGERHFQPAPHQGSIAVVVQDLMALVSRLGAKGVEPASGVFKVAMPKVGNTAVVFYRDPDGNMLEFMEVAGARNLDHIPES